MVSNTLYIKAQSTTFTYPNDSSQLHTDIKVAVNGAKSIG